MEDDSSQDDSKKPDEHSAEFDLSDIPGLNLAAQDSPAPDGISQNIDVSQNIDPAAETFAPESVPAPESVLAPEIAAAMEPAANPIQQVKEFSEKVQMENVQVPAALPFSLMIEGELTPEEKEKLVDVLSRENMGIREVDLEPQFAGNRVLIPRISEYAGILLVQALRGTRAKMRMGPSDSIFTTQDTDQASDPMQAGMALPEPAAPAPQVFDPHHPAELVAMTADARLPQFAEFDVIDTMLATALLDSATVEAEHSAEYSEILENLKRELKYKAYRKGAIGIIHFKVELQQLSLATQYRVMISGAAIRVRISDASPKAPVGTDSPIETSH